VSAIRLAKKATEGQSMPATPAARSRALPDWLPWLISVVVLLSYGDGFREALDAGFRGAFSDGTVVGSEMVVKPESAAKGVLEASEKAAPGSELVAVERVTGPEALGGAEWHVKRRLNGEVLRISVLDDGSIGRVYRKIVGETKVPR